MTIQSNYKIHSLLKASITLLLAVLLISACQCTGQKGTMQERPLTQKERKEQSIEAAKNFIAKEEASIEAYIKDRDFEMERSGTGVYYSIERDSSNLNFIQTGDKVEFWYEVFMLNGRLLYASNIDGEGNLLIDKEDAIIGLHQSLKMLSIGDEGLFIIPSHLAYGVSGDQHKVPPYTALQYNLKVLKVDKLKNPK